MKVRETCAGCGATFEAESRWPGPVMTMTVEWRNHHARCAQRKSARRATTNPYEAYGFNSQRPTPKGAA